jgi:hypothetical protein
MTQELQELYEYLQLNYQPLFENDLSIHEPDKDEKTDYVCCDQKIITFVDNKFNICDLYDSHPCVRFKTKEEVLSFYSGCIEGLHFYFDNDIEVAHSVGKIFSSSQTLNPKNVEEAVQKVVSPVQTKYNKEETL